MLAVDLVEALCGRLVVALLVEQEQALIVELVGRIIEHRVLVAAEPVREGRAGAERHRHERKREQARERAGAPAPVPTGPSRGCETQEREDFRPPATLKRRMFSSANRCPLRRNMRKAARENSERPPNRQALRRHSAGIKAGIWGFMRTPRVIPGRSAASAVIPAERRKAREPGSIYPGLRKSGSAGAHGSRVCSAPRRCAARCAAPGMTAEIVAPQRTNE